MKRGQVVEQQGIMWSEGQWRSSREYCSKRRPVVEQQGCCEERNPERNFKADVESGQEVEQYGNVVNPYCASGNIVKRVLLVEQKESLVNIYGVSGNTVNYSLFSLLHT